MVHAQRQCYDGAIAPIEDRRGSRPTSNKCDAEVIPLHIISENPAIIYYKRKNALCKRYLNPELSIKEMYKNFSENKENNKFFYKIYCMFLNLKILGFYDLYKTSVKCASTTKTPSKILITTLINVQYA